MARIVIVDYGLEDHSTLLEALAKAGADVCVSSDSEMIEQADGVVLAGRAAFADAMGALRESGLEEVCNKAIWDKKPFLGINVGMHMFFAVGCEIEKGKTGNKVVDGMAVRTGPVDLIPSEGMYGTPYEVPHTGMDTVFFDERLTCPLLKGLPDGQEFFFDHSFAAPTGPWVQAWTNYSIPIPAVTDFTRTCYGLQFHPEESGEAGLAVLSRFVEICEDPSQLEEKVERYATPEELAL